MRGENRRTRILILMSLLILPTMIGGCHAINVFSRDSSHDVFGFDRPVYEEKTGFETRTMRRERPRVWAFVTSAHGVVSILCVFAPASPFIWALKKHMFYEGGDFPAGYGKIVVPLSFLCQFIWARIYQVRF